MGKSMLRHTGRFQGKWEAGMVVLRCFFRFLQGVLQGCLNIGLALWQRAFMEPGDCYLVYVSFGSLEFFLFGRWWSQGCFPVGDHSLGLNELPVRNHR